MGSIQFGDIGSNSFGIRAPKTDDQNKYKILFVKNNYGEFYVTDEDNKRINNLTPKLQEILKPSIVGLYRSNINNNFFITNGQNIFVKKEALDFAMSTMKEQIEKEKNNGIGTEIQRVANLDGDKYFSEIRSKWNSVNLNDKNKTNLLQILQARQQALKTDPTLAHDIDYEYKLTVRLNKDNNRCDKKQDLSVPDGEWDKFATNLSQQMKDDFSDVIKAVYEERRCSLGNQFMDNTKSAFSNTLSRFRSSSSSPAAGGRRSKKRRTRGRRPSRRARKSRRRVRGRKSRK